MNGRLFLKIAVGTIIPASLVLHAFGCIVDDNPTSSHHATGTGGDTTTTGSPGPTTGPGGGQGGSGGNTPLNCAVFCSGMNTTCVGADAMYGDEAQCYAVCSVLPPGAISDTSGNTLGCRNHYLSLAKQSGQNADVYCINAGPSSAGACGKDCDNFCYLAGLLCTGPNQQWPDTASCLADCASFPNNENYQAGAMGDQFACRMYHLTVASEKPDPHCKHIAKMSDTCYDEMDAGSDASDSGPMDDGGGMMDAGSDSGDGG